MNDTVQHQAENHPAWEDWEDQGGFNDEESLMEKRITFQSAIFQKRPWYYEKKKIITPRTITFGVQMSFL